MATGGDAGPCRVRAVAGWQGSSQGSLLVGRRAGNRFSPSSPQSGVILAVARSIPSHNLMVVLRWVGVLSLSFTYTPSDYSARPLDDHSFARLTLNALQS